MNNANAKLEELNNSRLIPIVELEQIKSDMESTRSLASSYMDASDETETNNILTLLDTYNSALEQFIERFSSGKDNMGGQPPSEPVAQTNPEQITDPCLRRSTN